MEDSLITKATKREDKRSSNSILVNRFPFPKISIFRPDRIRSSLSFNSIDHDVFLCSYPKADTKLMEAILWNLLRPNVPLPQGDKITSRYLQCLEVIGSRAAKNQCSPRLIKTHLPVHLLPMNEQAKYVYVVRNPQDLCVVYYHFLKSTGANYESFDLFFHKFIYGLVPYGDYFEHISSWSKRSTVGDNVLLLAYESIKMNPRSTFFSVAAFLGEEYLQMALCEDHLLNEVLELSSSDEYKRRTQPFFLPRTQPLFLRRATFAANAENACESLEAVLSGRCPSTTKVKKPQAPKTYEYSREQKKKLELKTLALLSSTPISEFWKSMQEQD